METRLQPLISMLCCGRYGAPTSLQDYSWKASAAAIEGHRAFIEAYSKNKCAAHYADCTVLFPAQLKSDFARYLLSTGVVQWMLQPSWPSNIWQLFQCVLSLHDINFDSCVRPCVALQI